ncbi:SIR2 family NAD-dependent protein deacylase [Haloflavibacter putidus]|uniref:NAD-dependent protein deacylase n=1 Tax=Haloflavibacter putidus TaxID=2576776 RepID=A0A507ZQ39_9FLAO|nr:NAD-dependent deacylase [Haloflavibacter putidus]TQD39117.1 NAD-dependent deacylase [Haloflavibacter putidus]
MKNIVVLTGAGVSAESGIKTFRDADGLWEGYDVMQVASPQGWEANRELVLDFYNKRRQQLKSVHPNNAHKALAELESAFNVEIITQNVDDLHERAGSTNVTHLHGELFKVRSTFDENLIMDWKEDLNVGDFCEHNHQLRPHIVWFGEAVPMLEIAADKVSKADILIIIGTSMQVYPAAGLIDFAPNGVPIYFIDPKPAVKSGKNLEVRAQKAAVGVPQLVTELLEK